MRFGGSTTLFFLVIPLAGCLQVLGLGDYKDGNGGASAGGSTSASTVTGGTTASTGAGPCAPNMQQSCYDGPALTKDTGDCKSGTQTCAADGSGFGTCDGEQLPTTESCTTPGDEDCDGYSCSEVIWLEKGEPTSGHGRIFIANHPTDGSIYVSGTFAGGIQLATAQLTSAGASDAFVARLNKDGTVAWSFSFGDGSDQGFGPIVVDSSGNAYVEGASQSAFTLDGKSVSPGFFVAKLGPDGHASWVTSCGGAQTFAFGLGLTPDGVVAGGSFGGTTTLNCGVTALNPASGKGFIVRLSSAGVEQWNHQLPVGGNGLAVDSTGSTIVVGGISQPTNFGGSLLSPVGGAIGAASFVAKFSGSGAHAWSQIYGEKVFGAAGASGAAVDMLGNVYFTGSFGNTMNVGGFGSMSSITSDGGADLYVAKLTGDGAGKWVRRLGNAFNVSPFTQFAYSQAIAALGSDVLVFGDGNLQVDTISSTAAAFIAKFSQTDASTLWTRDATGSIGVTGASMGPDREAVVAASFLGTVAIDSQSIMCDGCQTTLDNGMFVARLGR